MNASDARVHALVSFLFGGEMRRLPRVTRFPCRKKQEDIVTSVFALRHRGVSPKNCPTSDPGLPTESSHNVGTETS